MINENIVIGLLIVIPLLTLILSFVLYLEYKKRQEHKALINMLLDEQNQILEHNRKTNLDQINELTYIQKQLNYGGFSQGYSEYLFYIISIGFGLGVSTFIYLIVPSFIISVVTGVLFSFFPFFVLKRIITNRQNEFNLGLKFIIDKVSSMMKNGVGFEQAFKKSIVTSKSEFTREVFGIYLSEKDIIGEEASFDKMFKIVESKELRIFYLVISIGRQSGGKFSNTLDILRKTLQDQGVIKQEITSSTREIKVGTYMILGLTIGIYIMINFVFEGALNDYFLGSTTGQLQLFFITLWVMFGLFVNNMMTKVKD